MSWLRPSSKGGNENRSYRTATKATTSAFNGRMTTLAGLCAKECYDLLSRRRSAYILLADVAVLLHTYSQKGVDGRIIR